VVTAAIGIVAATTIKRQVLLSSFLLSTAIVVGVSALINLSNGTNYGLFGSKNYYGLCVSMMIPTGLAVALSRHQPKMFRLVAVAAILLAPALLVQSMSTGALIFSLITLVLIFGLSSLQRLTVLARIVIITLLVLVGSLLALGWMYIGDFSKLLNAVGKDATLTGRTYLWSAAWASISQNPILGLGYQSYWQIGNWGAEELWKIMFITSRSGFHFHNTYLQVTADLGIVGLIMLIGTLILAILKTLRNLVFLTPTPERIFATYIICFLLLRSPIEVDLFWPFQTPTLLLCMAWVYLDASGHDGVANRMMRVG
jgi:exopolysaccharide production protein ExoQ